jgi:hypothetical protein
LDKIRVDINRHYQEVIQTDGFVTADKVKNTYLGLEVKQDTFLTLFAKHNQEFSRKVGYNRAKGTYSKYCTLYKHMENYIRQEYKRDDIFLKELNLAFINGFEHYLRTERECSTNTIWMYMIGVKHIVAIACNSGQFAINPFAGYLISPEVKDRGFLNKEELNLLINTKMKIVPEVISRTYVGYFPPMASLPLGGAEARENNQRHENNFYLSGVGKRF